MPTYDYECDACGHAWEMFQRIVEDAIKKCPECKKKKARRLFGTGSAVMFKGSGFYETDYRSDSYKKGEKAAKDAKASKSDSGGDKSSKSKGSDSSSSKKKSSD
jgi:putative FmdB family regulatory protein